MIDELHIRIITTKGEWLKVILSIDIFMSELENNVELGSEKNDFEVIDSIIVRRWFDNKGS